MKKFILMILSVVLFQNFTYADSERMISIEQLPVAAQKFLKTHFANQPLTYAKVDGYMFDVDYEVRLVDGTKIDFDRKGNWTNAICSIEKRIRRLDKIGCDNSTVLLH